MDTLFGDTQTKSNRMGREKMYKEILWVMIIATTIFGVISFITYKKDMDYRLSLENKALSSQIHANNLVEIRQQKLLANHQ